MPRSSAQQAADLQPFIDMLEAYRKVLNEAAWPKTVSLAAFAKRIGVSKQGLRDWYQKNTWPTEESLEKIIEHAPEAFDPDELYRAAGYAQGRPPQVARTKSIRDFMFEEAEATQDPALRAQFLAMLRHAEAVYIESLRGQGQRG